MYYDCKYSIVYARPDYCGAGPRYIISPPITLLAPLVAYCPPVALLAHTAPLVSIPLLRIESNDSSYDINNQLLSSLFGCTLCIIA